MKKTMEKPKAEVLFYTERGELVARSIKNPGSSKFNGDIVSIQTGRDMGDDSPTFSINLTRDEEWDKWVGSNDLVIISLWRTPDKKKNIFYGLVDDSRRSTITSGNEVQRVITISGRGFAKAFIDFEVGYVPEAEVIEFSTGWLQMNGVTLAGSTGDKIVEATWDNIAKKHMDYKWGSNRNLFSLAKRKLSFRSNAVLVHDIGLINYQGSMWAFLKKVSDPPFHELFWEILDGKPTLVLRPTPFNKSAWNKLPRHTITDGDVVQDIVGKSDVETYTLFSVSVETAFSPEDQSKTLGVIPVWNEKFADKYGIKRLTEETLYSAVADADDVEGSAELVERYQKDLYNWNIKNNSFYNGTIIVRGENKYKVGDRLLYKSKEDNITREYYITSVNHTFVYYGNWQTELGVTRGIEPKERFTAPVGKHETYSGMGLVEYDPEGARNNRSNLLGLIGFLNPIGGVYSDQANEVIRIAKSLMGKVTYQFGGPGISAGRADCSQFTQYCYQRGAGMELGRTTPMQIQKGTKLGVTRSGNLTSTNIGLAEPGDLVFFAGTIPGRPKTMPSHVGIYLGNDEMIHLSSSRNVNIDTIMSNSYWGPKFMQFNRVLDFSTSNSNGYISGGKGGKVMSMKASAYGGHTLNVMGGPGFVATWKTASGATTVEGTTIAVDPKVIPLGTRVRVECSSYPSVNGEYIAQDTGGAIKGNRIDIYFDDKPPKDPYAARKRMLAFGMRDVKVTILG